MGGCFQFHQCQSVSVCQHGRGGGIKTRLSLSRDTFITPTLLNQPAWIECILWDPELCELTQREVTRHDCYSGVVER